MTLSSIPDTLKKIKEIADMLLGPDAVKVLLLIAALTILLVLARESFADARSFIDLALLACFLFGIVVTAYGVFQKRDVKGLSLAKGLPVGLIAGVLAALTGGAFYFLANDAECCTADPSIKLFRILSASAPIGAVLGGLMGRLRPVGRPAKPSTSEAERAQRFLTFVTAILILSILCIVFFYVFNNMGSLIQDTRHPQGLIRFWQVALVVVSFTIIFTGLLVYRYGRADESGHDPDRLKKAAACAIAATLSCALLFTPAIWALGPTDFQPRSNVSVCTAPPAPGGACRDCNDVCRGDPRGDNAPTSVVMRTILLAILAVGAFFVSTHPRSPLLAVLDRALLVEPARTIGAVRKRR